MRWNDQEMSSINMKDKRLDKRTIMMLDNLTSSPESSFTQCFKSRAELVAAYRFFDNNYVKPEKILAPHYESTRSRIKQEKVVLLPNDTSSIDFTNKPGIEGLGILETAFTRGLFIHPTLAITPDRVCLGIVDELIWARDGDAKRKSLPSQVRYQQAIEEKESYRWIHSYRIGCRLAEEYPETQFVNIGDRESDILELIIEAVEAKANNNGADIIIRINHDRALEVDKDNKGIRKLKKKSEATLIEEMDLEIKDDEIEERKLKKKLVQAPSIGKIEFTMPARTNQPARDVVQILRARKIRLKGKKVGDKTYASVEINAICAIEEAPPIGEKPICWMFFTTLPIDTREQVFNVIKYYLCRWEIEVFFKILKSGCKVEEKELKTADRIQNMLALFLIVAWRVAYIMTMGRKVPEIACTELFEDAEWKSVWKIVHNGSILPSEPPTLGEFVFMIGKLGGYQQRSKGAPPGPKVIWKGLTRMSDFALAWEKFGK